MNDARRRWVVVKVLAWRLTVAVLACTSHAFGEVSLPNRNFAIGYTDLTHRGPSAARIERVYNSNSSFKGTFGVGWGAAFDVRLALQADGSIVIAEYGGGAENEFLPAAGRNVADGVERIVQSAQRERPYNDQQLAQYRAKLTSENTFRIDEWARLSKFRTLPEVAAGTVFLSMQFGRASVTKTATGYRRDHQDGSIEEFDNDGFLTKATERNGAGATFEWKGGRLESIRQSPHAITRFHYDRSGFVARIVGPNGRIAYYRHNDRGELIYSRDVDDNVYVYAYSVDGMSNLVRIGYGDGTQLSIAYNDRQGSVRRIVGRDNSITSYSYEDKSSGVDRTFTVTVAVDLDRVVERTTHIFVKRRLADQSEALVRSVVDDGETRTTTDFEARCFKPVRIQEGSKITTFEYDERCNVVRAASSTGTKKFAYDSDGRILSSVEYDAKTRRKLRTVGYQYDSRGNLIEATDGSKKVHLAYDVNGRVKAVRGQELNVEFEYGPEGEPTKVAVEGIGIGDLDIIYRNGEISKIESSGGKEIALKVTAAFQQLLELIGPAGVSISI